MQVTKLLLNHNLRASLHMQSAICTWKFNHYACEKGWLVFVSSYFLPVQQSMDCHAFLHSSYRVVWYMELRLICWFFFKLKNSFGIELQLFSIMRVSLWSVKMIVISGKCNHSMKHSGLGLFLCIGLCMCDSKERHIFLGVCVCACLCVYL